MSVLELDVHGVGIRVGGDAATLAALRADFALFERPGVRPSLSLSVQRGDPGPAPRGGFRWRGCRYFDDGGGLRVIHYREGARLEYDYGAEAGALTAASDDLLHELAYLCLLSRAGWKLDLAGLHRVHALGFTALGKAGLILLPSGGGKTTLALELLKLPGFSLLSDDIPLVSADGLVLPMPLRLGVRGRPVGVPARMLAVLRRRRYGEKTLIHPDFFAKRVGAAAPAAWLIAARPSKGAAVLKPGPAGRELMRDLVAGIGTPQVLELLSPRPPYARTAAELAGVAAARWRTARALQRRCRSFRLELGQDPAAAARLLRLALAPGLPASERGATIAA